MTLIRGFNYFVRNNFYNIKSFIESCFKHLNIPYNQIVKIAQAISFINVFLFANSEVVH